MLVKTKLRKLPTSFRVHSSTYYVFKIQHSVPTLVGLIGAGIKRLRTSRPFAHNVLPLLNRKHSNLENTTARPLSSPFAMASATSAVLVNGKLVGDFPPAPVLWITAAIDTLCLLGCSDWRESLQISPSSVWHAKVPSLLEHLPPMTTYDDFLMQESLQPSNVSEHLAALYQFVAETPSTSLGNLATPAAWIALIILVIGLRRIKRILLPFFSSWGRAAARRTHGPGWEAQNEERIAKFGEYVFRLFYHSFISIYGVYYFWDKEWWASNGTLSLFQGFPYHSVEPGMIWYYLIQAAYNFDAMVSLLELSFIWDSQRLLKGHWPWTWSPKVRGDFQEMMIHHVITNLLVIGSSVCRLTRIGSMVFLVHDISDVPVDLSKLANFLKWKITTLVCFFTMMGVWLATRLYTLPVIIYGAILTQSQYVVQDGLPVLLYVHYRYIFYVLVGLLILLHVAWFGMFLQMLATFVRRNECHDLSEHKKGESLPDSPASSAISDESKKSR